MRRTTAGLIAILACVAAALAAGSAWAMSEQELDQRVLEISDQLRCPTCQAISVKDSEAAFSRQIRDKVRSMLREGKTEEEIRAYFVSSYGEWILRAPKKEGVGLLLWSLPFAAIVLAGGLIAWRLRRATQKPRPEPTPATPDDAGKARIERDLRRFERGF